MKGKNSSIEDDFQAKLGRMNVDKHEKVNL